MTCEHWPARGTHFPQRWFRPQSGQKDPWCCRSDHTEQQTIAFSKPNIKITQLKKECCSTSRAFYANILDHVYTFTNSKNQPHDCFSEQLLKNPKLKIGALGYRWSIFHPCGQVDKRYSKIFLSPFPYPLTFRGGGGCYRKGGGVSGPNDKTIPTVNRT